MGNTNSEVAHAWAHHRALKGGSIRSDGDILWSYAEPIGRHLINGEAVLLSRRNFSVTTSSHQSEARKAVSHLRDIQVYNIPKYEITKEWAKQEIERLVTSMVDSLGAAERAKTRAYLHIQDAEKYRSDAEFLTRHFKIRKKFSTYEKEIKKSLKAAEKERKKREEQEAKRLVETILKWKAKEPVSIPYSKHAYLRLVGDIVETSKGLRIPAKKLASYVSEYKDHGKIPESVLNYRINHVDNKHVVIGCHDIPWGEIDEVLAAYATG